MMKQMKADVVVVGSGPGGATVARDLTLKGKKVVILERGADVKPSANMFSAARFLSAGGVWPLGRGIMLTPDMLTMLRALTVGGSSIMYTASAWDPPYEAFQKYGVDITPEDTAKIKKELKIAPLDDRYIGPGTKAISQAALELGLAWEKIPKFIDPSKGPFGCNHAFFGSPNGVKWEARAWIMDAVASGATLLTKTYCDDVIIENGVAVGVRATGKRGAQYEIHANTVVVAAGGVGSPAILQRTGIMEAGRKFFFDPFIMTFGYTDKPVDVFKEFPMVAGVHMDEGLMVTDLMMPWMLYAYNSTFALKLFKAVKTKGMVGLMTKIKDGIGGTVSITEKINKPLTFDDHEKLNIGRIVSRQILMQMNAKDIWYSQVSAAHPGGTCRIGEVVDKNLETKFKNLYVSDASVIPEQFGLPPVLTLITLGRRLSKHIAG